jgi:hypothetical protein
VPEPLATSTRKPAQLESSATTEGHDHLTDNALKNPPSQTNAIRDD